jgi:hypothetical protein
MNLTVFEYETLQKVVEAAFRDPVLSLADVGLDKEEQKAMGRVQRKLTMCRNSLLQGQPGASRYHE